MAVSLSASNKTSLKGSDTDSLSDSKTFVLHPSVIGITAIFSLYVLFLVVYYLVFTPRKKEKLAKLKLSAAPVDDIVIDNWLHRRSSLQKGTTFSTGFQNTVNVLDGKSLFERKIVSLSDMAAIRQPSQLDLDRQSNKFHRCKSTSAVREYSKPKSTLVSNTDKTDDVNTVVFTLGSGQESFCSQIEKEGFKFISPTTEECNFDAGEGQLNRCSTSKSSIARTPSYRKACFFQDNYLEDT